MRTDDRRPLGAPVAPEPPLLSQRLADAADPVPPMSQPEGGVLTATRGKRNGALDGLRGLAVIAVMAYHVVPDPFTGGWLGVDVFMVLSGFLICSMLLRERIRTNTINYKRFLIRRARRLLPGLALMLVAILAAAMLWESAGRRKHVALDVISSAFQVSNWRLIWINESYFTKVGIPSPIRHTWSLGVQEQFYFIFPLILLLLMVWVRRWRSLIIIFTVLAAISTWRMIDLYVPGTDPSRVYFGTDTRLSELLIGVVGAIILFQRTQIAAKQQTGGPRTWNRATETLIGWAGLASISLIVYWMFTVNEFSPWLFQGGLIFIASITMIIITAATSPYPNVMTRLLATKPLMKAGDMSYSLYIWHWPIIVYLAPALPGSSELTRQILAVALTITISWISYTFVENPIHKHGLAGLRPQTPRLGGALAFASMPTILIMALILSNTAAPNTESDSLTLRLAADPHYGKSVEELPDEVVPHEVIMVGASTVVNLDFDGQTELTPDINLNSAANLNWCTPYERTELDRLGERGTKEECAIFREKWVNAIAQASNPTVVMVMMTRILSDFIVDGQQVAPGTSEHDAVVRDILDELAEISIEQGAARFALINLSCQNRDETGRDITVGRANDTQLVKHINSVMESWASEVEVAEVYDIYALLCPGDAYFEQINERPLYSDGLHYTSESAPLIWQWIAQEVREHVARDTA